MLNHKIKFLLTEAPEEGVVSNEYFYRMLSPQALQLSTPYHQEESSILEKCLKTISDTDDLHFVAVGGGELWELPRALTYTKSYTCVEPLADVFINNSVKFLIEQREDISYVPKRFGDVAPTDLSPGNNFFMFLFNIFAYIDNPIAAINRLLKPGDVLFISTWTTTPEAKRHRGAYFNYLNSFDEQATIDPNDNTGLCHIDNFSFDDLCHFKRYERYTGKITDILIIYA